MNRVWVVADVFKDESPYIRPGMTAFVSFLHQGDVYEGRVSDVPPQFDAAARTLQVRIEVDNPHFALRPEMLTDVEIPMSRPPRIVVSQEAVIDSGLRRTVFVDLGGGSFESRVVETGARFGGQVEITEGLTPGERVVVSGNFLIDSESRMRLASARSGGTQEQYEVCSTDAAQSGREFGREQGRHSHQGHQIGGVGTDRDPSK